MTGKGGKKGNIGKTQRVKQNDKAGKTRRSNQTPREREGHHGSSSSAAPLAGAEAEAMVAEDSPSSDSNSTSLAALPPERVSNASRQPLLTANVFNYEPPVRGAGASAAAPRGSGAGDGRGADAGASRGGDDGDGGTIPPSFIFCPVLWTPNGWRYELMQVEMDVGRDSGLRWVPEIADDSHDDWNDHLHQEDEA